jgi:hypothetical protein
MVKEGNNVDKPTGEPTPVRRFSTQYSILIMASLE